MPTYDYVCDDCRHEFEAYESIKADPQTECPSCHKPTLRRKIGAGAAILFKGSGFYQTDYRSESYKQKAKADQPPSSASSSTSSDSSSNGSSAPAKSSDGPSKPSTAGGGSGGGSGSGSSSTSSSGGGGDSK